MLCNPKSGSKYAESFLTNYPKVNNRMMMIPAKLLTDANISSNEQLELDCTLYLYNVCEATDRMECREMLRKDLIENPASDKILGIMGGDGSMGTTLKFLREIPEIEAGLVKKDVGMCILPFGTGNDTA